MNGSVRGQARRVSVQTPGVLAGRYELGPLVGAGGTARVHRAVDRQLGRTVAVKVFRLDVEGAELERIEREAQILSGLQHPGLVRVYDAGGFAVGDGPPTPYLVMELVTGPTWSQCCMGGSLSPQQIAATGAELARTLAYVHAQGVVHRDVKPANILLADGDRPKLADFGIALLADSAALTRTGLTIGTAPYLSPEQVSGRPVGPPTDVYALGLVLLEALTGRREYAGAGTEAALARLHRPPAVPDDAPPPLRDALRAMTATDPAARPTAAQAARLLDAAADRPGEAPTRTLTTATPLPARPLPDRTVPDRDGPGVVREVLRESVRSRGAWLLLAPLVLVGLVLAALALTAGSGGDPAGTAPDPAPSSDLEAHLAELREAVTP